MGQTRMLNDQFVREIFLAMDAPNISHYTGTREQPSIFAARRDSGISHEQARPSLMKSKTGTMFGTGYAA